MDEVMGEQRSRTVVRGSACTYQMPWEEIARDLTSHCTDADGTPQLPRSQESLKYFIRVLLTIAGVDMKKYMKQIHVRPFVLVRLVEYLIDSKHEAYRSSQDTADAFKAKLLQKTEAEYPKTEAHLPEDAREGQIPLSIREVLQEFEEESKRPNGTPKMKPTNISYEKNATPVDGARSVESCLDEIRPHSISVGCSASSVTDPATAKQSGFQKHGDEATPKAGMDATGQLSVQSGTDM